MESTGHGLVPMGSTNAMTAVDSMQPMEWAAPRSPWPSWSAWLASSWSGWWPAQVDGNNVLDPAGDKNA